MKFTISYYYLATGMEGNADTLPTSIIEADNKDLAIFRYWQLNGTYNDLTFQEFMLKPEWERNWGISCE